MKRDRQLNLFPPKIVNGFIPVALKETSTVILIESVETAASRNKEM